MDRLFLLSQSRTQCSNQRGSALVMVLLFGFLVFMIITGFLPSVLLDYRVSRQNEMANAAYYIAEAGAEEAMWYLNQEAYDDWSSDGWEESTDGKYWKREIDFSDELFDLNDGWEASIRLVVEKPKAGAAVKIYSHGIVEKGDGSDSLSKVIVLSTTQPKIFEGLIAKDTLSFSGQPQFDSYDSSVFPYTYAPGSNTWADIHSGSDPKSLSVGSISDSAGTVSLGNASVDGNVVSGASDPLGSGAVTQGPNSTVTGSYKGNFTFDFKYVGPPDTTGWNTSF